MSHEKRILIVEGPNDAHVVLSLMGANNIHAEFRNYRTPHFSNEESLEIREKGGIVQAQNFENLLESLAIEVKAASDGFLGVVVDANSSLENRWRSLRDRLRSDSIGYDNVSDLPVAEGLVLERREFFLNLGFG
jgi:hypothetical protein